MSQCYHAELYKMVCDRNETNLNIMIPAVMLPKDAGNSIENITSKGAKGRCIFSYYFSGACCLW